METSLVLPHLRASTGVDGDSILLRSDTSPAVRGPFAAGGRRPFLPLPPPSSSDASFLSSLPIFVVLVTWPGS